jgi:hypothetical protein
MALCVGCKGPTEPSSSSQNGNEYLKCAEVDGDSHIEKINLPPLTLVRDGQDLKISGLSSSIVSVGLLSGIHELTAESKKNLQFFFNQFKAAKVQAIIVVGGVGKTKKQITEIFNELGLAPVPVLITPGAQESYGGLKAVFKKLHKKFPHLVDMTAVRRVMMKQVNFISLPGYYNPFYLEARSQGCSYEKSDLDSLENFVMKDMANVLVSATPPKGSGPFDPDLGRGNIHIGDPDLTQMLAPSSIRFGLFGHVYEAGGNAVSKNQNDALAPGIWHPSMYLQAGSADAIPVRLTNGGRVAGIAHIVDFSGHRVRFKQIVAR